MHPSLKIIDLKVVQLDNANYNILIHMIMVYLPD